MCKRYLLVVECRLVDGEESEGGGGGGSIWEDFSFFFFFEIEELF